MRVRDPTAIVPEPVKFFFMRKDAQRHAKLASSSSSRGMPSMFTISKPITRQRKPKVVPRSCDRYLEALSREKITSLPEINGVGLEVVSERGNFHGCEIDEVFDY